MSKIINGDALQELRKLPDASVDCCVTSPPYYGLRDYGIEGQIGLEETPEEYIRALVEVFREVYRVMKPQGTLWLNIGDSYWGSGSRGLDFTGKKNGYKNKDLIGIPWMLAFSLRADGWYLRQDIIWHKPNPMPESVTDRCTRSHEYLFLMSKQQHYYFNQEALREKAAYPNDDRGSRTDSRRGTTMNSMSGSTGEFRNKRDVWSITIQPTKEAHFATFPEKLVEPCILAGCPVGGVVLDPFFGSGTTGIVATKLNRDYIGIELNPEYIDIINKRTDNIQLTLTGLADGL